MVVHIQETGGFRIKWVRASVSPSVPGVIPAILTDDKGVALGGPSAFGIGPNYVTVR